MARYSSSMLLLFSLLITSSQAICVLSRYFSFSVGFEYKGPLGYAFSGPGDDPTLVRLYEMVNWHTFEAIYTTDQDERQRLLLDPANWEDELYTDNPAWKGKWVYGDEGPARDRVPLYRLVEPATSVRVWTVSETEVKELETQGWTSEGISCYFPNPASQPTGTAEMIHRYNWLRESAA